MLVNPAAVNFASLFPPGKEKCLWRREAQFLFNWISQEPSTPISLPFLPLPTYVRLRLKHWISLTRVLSRPILCVACSVTNSSKFKLSKKNSFNFVSKNCKNCQKLSNLSKNFKIVKMLVKWCFFITVIKYLKGHWSLESLLNVKKQKVGQWLSEWVSEWQGHLLSCQVTAKN